MKKMLNRFLAVCLTMGLCIMELNPGIVYAQEITDPMTQGAVVEEENKENDIESIDVSEETESSGTETVVETADTEADSETEVSETTFTESETETVETEVPVEIHTITGVKELPEQDKRIDASYEDKPSMEELVSVMPTSMEVYLDGSDKAETIPVSWYCVTEDYEDTEGHYYQFSPVFDGKQYQLSDGLNILTDVPYIGVFLESGNGIATYAAGSESSNTTVIFNYLMNEMKMNSAAACGVLANIYYESGFDPHAVGDNNSSYGICQWHAERKTNLINYCKENNLDYTTLEGQLQFLKYELANSYSSIYNYMLNVKNTADGAYDAGWYWCYYFEVPANRETVAVTRGNLAKNTYWEQYGVETLTAPELTDIQNTSAGIWLKWQIESGVSGYNIYRKTSLTDAWVRTGTVSDGDTNHYTDKSVKSGTTYYYAVTACSGGDLYDTYVTTADLNYRTGPGTSYSKAGTLDKGTCVKVVPGYSKTADGYTWYKIHYAGSDYYVVADYLKKDTSASDNTNIKESEKSSYKSIVFLSTVTVSKTTNTSAGVKVSWEKVTGAKNYYVYRKVSGGKYTKLGKVSGSSLSYTDKTAESGKTYIYTVRAAAGSIMGSYKSTSTILYLACPVLKSSDNVQNGIKVSWDKVNGANGYYVYRKVSGGKYSRIASVSGSVLNYTDKKAENGTTYVYTVRARKDSTLSSYYSSKEVICLSTPQMDKAVSKQGGMRVSWKKVSGASGYYVYRKMGSGKWQKIGSTKKESAVSYRDGSAIGGLTYSYTVRAYKNAVLSGYDGTGITQKFSQNLSNYKTTMKVNYRTGAGTSYKTAGTLNQGVIVKVVSDYSVQADGYTWYKIYYNGKYYYVANKYLKKA